jgi:hypothetical protein
MKQLLLSFMTLYCLCGMAQHADAQKSKPPGQKTITSLKTDLIPGNLFEKIEWISPTKFLEESSEIGKMEIKGKVENYTYSLKVSFDKIEGIMQELDQNSKVQKVFAVNIIVSLWCCTPASSTHTKHSCGIDKIKETTKKENCTNWMPCEGS